MVAPAAAGRGVEVEDHSTARPLQHAVEQFPQVAFGAFVGDGQSVDLERADAVFVVEVDEGLRILLPVGVTVLYARVEPEADLHAQFPAQLHDRVQSPGVFLRVGFPVVGIVPDVFERPLRHGGVGAFAHLPAVVDLEMRDAQVRGLPDIGQAEPFVHLRVLAAVAPRVHHHHLVASGKQFPDVFLVASQGRQLFEFPARPDSEDASVGFHPLPFAEVLLRHAQSRHREIAELCREVPAAVGRLHARSRGLLQEEEPAAVLGVAGEEQVAPVAVFPVGNDVGFEDQVVVPVRDVLELHDPRVPVEPAGVEPVEGRGDRLRLHVGGRFDVLPVGCVDRPAAGKLCDAAFEVGVAGDRWGVGADAVDPPHVERSQ